MNKLFATFFLFFVLLSASTAQDQHFSQFYAAPLSLNPALTGAMEGSYRVGTVYRDQWRKVMEQPVRTFSFFADLRFDKKGKKFTNDAFGLGIMFFNDKAGIVDFSTTQIAVSLAYHKALDLNKRQYLTLGMQGGLNQRNMNYGNLQFHDQFDGSSGYWLQTAEILPANNFSFPDYSIGLNYKARIGDENYVFLGGAMHHLFQPQVTFFGADSLPGSKLYTRYSAQAAANIPLSRDNRVQISPRLLVATQGPHLQVNAGASMRFAMGQYGSTALNIGAWARQVRNDNGTGFDAVTALVGIELNSMIMGFSYDLNPGALKANLRQSAFELSITYRGNYDNDDIVCPKF